MRVELGWAFFTRMEACLETLASHMKIPSGSGILRHLEARRCDFSDHEQVGLKLYREIRNTLHHGDGDTSYLRTPPKVLRIEPEREPHLLEEHMESYYRLFKKVGQYMVESGQS